MEILEYYTHAKNYVSTHGYKEEVNWCENREPFEFCTKETFFFEYVYVVLNAGMKEQIARKIFESFCKDLDANTIGHTGKRKAIIKALDNYEKWFTDIKSTKTNELRIDMLDDLPFIGVITKYHLARNIGIDCVKPDRHLVRLAERFGFKTPHDMCIYIQAYTKERLGVIDVILWRFCNLNGSKTESKQ